LHAWYESYDGFWGHGDGDGDAEYDGEGHGRLPSHEQYDESVFRYDVHELDEFNG